MSDDHLNDNVSEEKKKLKKTRKPKEAEEKPTEEANNIVKKRKKKKRKRGHDIQVLSESINPEEPPTKKQKTDNTEEPKSIQPWTLSIAVPASLIQHAQGPHLKTHLAGQIARIAAIFKVDEVVVYGEGEPIPLDPRASRQNTDSDCSSFLARILQYLECPQYLRKAFFPRHRDLEFAGLLAPLETPHHMKVDDVVPYREGVVLDRPVKEGTGSWVDVGLRQEVKIDKHLQPGVRVTVKMPTEPSKKPGSKRLKGTVVSPTEPRIAHGLYWGYAVRVANSLAEVFSNCPYEAGYDLTVGVSTGGRPVEDVFGAGPGTASPREAVAQSRHMLVVFGGVGGLEGTIEADSDIEVKEPNYLFDYYVSTCPQPGTRTLRTEEAMLMTLAVMRPAFSGKQ